MYLCHTTAKECPNCGYVFPRPEIEEKKIENIVEVELTKKLMINGRKISTLDPKELAMYAGISNNKHFATRVAVAKGYEFLRHNYDIVVKQ